MFLLIILERKAKALFVKIIVDWKGILYLKGYIQTAYMVNKNLTWLYFFFWDRSRNTDLLIPGTNVSDTTYLLGLLHCPGI